MTFYQSVFFEKNFFENIRKKKSGLGVITLIFTLSHQNYDSKNYFLKLKLYMPQICGVAQKNLKHFKFW